MNITKKLFTKFTQVAYKSREVQEVLERHLATIPYGWELLANSADNADTAAHNYRALAFVNKATKQVIFASAGTDPKSLDDINDDILLMRHQAFTKIYSIKEFIPLVLSKIENPEEYTFSSAGHSLGGAVSDITAYVLKTMRLNVIESITFDNPGAKPVIEDAVKKGIIAKLAAKEEGEISFVSNLVRPNLINTTNTQMGEIQLVILPKDIQVEVAEEKAAVVSYSNFLSYLSGKVGSALWDTVAGLNPFGNSIIDLVSNAMAINSAYQHMYDPKYIATAILKLSKFAPIYEETTKFLVSAINRLNHIYDNAKAVIEGHETIAEVAKLAGIIASIYMSGGTLAPSLIPEVIEATNSLVSLGQKAISLYGETTTLYEESIRVVKYAPRLTEHKLDNFVAAFNTGEDNTLEVLSGYNKSDKGLKVKVGKTLFAKFKSALSSKKDAPHHSEEHVENENKDTGFFSNFKKLVSKKLDDVKRFFKGDQHDEIEVSCSEDGMTETVKVPSNLAQEVIHHKENTKPTFSELLNNVDLSPDDIFAQANDHVLALTGENGLDLLDAQEAAAAA